MTRPEWGAKHACQHCGAKYYDLQRSPVVCPKCGTGFNPEALLRSRRSKPVVPEKRAVAAKVAEPAADADKGDAERKDEVPAAQGGKTDELADAEDDAEDGKLIEDASELGEDDKDVAEVRVGDGEKEDT